MLRITDGWVKAAIWFILITMNIMAHLIALFTWVSCTPILNSYDPTIPGTCWAPAPLLAYNIFVGACSAAMDIAPALLPWRVILKLQMKKEKIGVAIATSMGLLYVLDPSLSLPSHLCPSNVPGSGATAIMKCMKLPTLYQPDFTYNVASIIKWGTAELTTTIIAATIPVLRVLFKTVGTTQQYN